jgi:hypothetical protein
LIISEAKILHGDVMFKKIREWVTASKDEWNEHNFKNDIRENCKRELSYWQTYLWKIV